MSKSVINKTIDQGIGHVAEEVTAQKHGCEHAQAGLQVQVGGGSGRAHHQDDQIGEVADVRHRRGYQEH